jgi:CRP/FNR family cyclic AMP-dependent transcriptional regulator
MKTVLRPDELARIPLLAALTRRDRERLASVLRDRVVAAGEVAAAEGEDGIGFFMIVAGSATVEQDGTPVRTLAAGDWFGEIAVLGDGRRTATVRALEELHCVGMTPWQFRPFLSEHPEIALTIAETMAERLAPADA